MRQGEFVLIDKMTPSINRVPALIHNSADGRCTVVAFGQEAIDRFKVFTEATADSGKAKKQKSPEAKPQMTGPVAGVNDTRALLANARTPEAMKNVATLLGLPHLHPAIDAAIALGGNAGCQKMRVVNLINKEVKKINDGKSSV